MTKRILVYTYGVQSHKHTLELASKYAAEHNAHLTGIYIKPDYANYSHAYGPHLFSVLDTLPKQLEEQSHKNEQDFNKALTTYGASGEWHSMDEFQEGPNPAFYTDCIFIGQVANESDTLMLNGFDFIDQQILSTGLPIILVPNNWTSENFAVRPVLGWKESKEAAGAVRHALPFLRRAEKVDVISVTNKNDPDKQLIDGIQISEFLSAHSVNSTFNVVTMREQHESESDALLDYVKHHNNDLIVIGSYSHARLKEIFFGGMTRDLIKHSSVPVLLAH